MKKVKTITALFSTIFPAFFILMFWWSCETEKVGPTEPPGNFIQGDYFLMGYVTDADTEEPLEGVVLRIGDELEFVTDQSGFYSTTNYLSPGIYIFEAFKNGYLEIEGKLEFNDNGNDFTHHRSFELVKIRSAVEVKPESAAIVVESNSFGDYKLSIPEGAVSQNTSISVTPTISGGGPVFENGENFIINSVYMSPSGMTFSKTVELEVPMTISNPDLLNLAVSVYSYNADLKEWTYEGKAQLSDDSSSLKIGINHFSHHSFTYNGMDIWVETTSKFGLWRYGNSTEIEGDKIYDAFEFYPSSDGLPENIMKTNIGVNPSPATEYVTCVGKAEKIITCCARALLKDVNFLTIIGNDTVLAGYMQFPEKTFPDCHETDAGSGSTGGNGD